MNQKKRINGILQIPNRILRKHNNGYLKSHSSRAHWCCFTDIIETYIDTSRSKIKAGVVIKKIEPQRDAFKTIKRREDVDNQRNASFTNSSLGRVLVRISKIKKVSAIVRSDLLRKNLNILIKMKKAAFFDR